MQYSLKEFLPMDGHSLFKLVGLPDTFSSLLLVIALILSLAPYFSGADFGVLKVPNFDDSFRKRLKVVGPALLILVIFMFLPIVPPPRPPNEVYNPQDGTQVPASVCIGDGNCPDNNAIIYPCNYPVNNLPRDYKGCEAYFKQYGVPYLPFYIFMSTFKGGTCGGTHLVLQCVRADLVTQQPNIPAPTGEIDQKPK
jgi:hypothetical protein